MPTSEAGGKKKEKEQETQQPMLSSTTAGRPPPPPRTASNSSIHSNSAAANASLSRSTTQDSHSRLPSRANSGAGIVGASFGIPSSPIFSSASLSRREPSPLPSSLRPSVPAFAFSNRSKAGPMQIDWDSPRSQAPPDSPFARAWAELQMQRSSSARGSDVDMDETATSIGTGRATAAQQEPTDQSRSKLGPKDGTATVTSQVGSDGGAGSDDREQGHYAKGKESWLSMSAAAPSAVTTSPRKALSLKSRGFRNQATPGNGRTPLLATGENSNGVVDSEEDAMRITTARKRKKYSMLDDTNRNEYEKYSGPQETNSYSKHLLLANVAMGYLRFGFTLFTMGLSVYIIVQFVWTVHHDLEMKAVEYSSEIARQVSECSKSYFENRCDPVAGRLPAMQALCSEWELCMSRDPKEVGRLQVGAETIAEILNKLFEPMTAKTMAFGSILFFGSLFLWFTSPSLSSLRGSTSPIAGTMIQSQPQHPPVPLSASVFTGNTSLGAGHAISPAPNSYAALLASAPQQHHHYYGGLAHAGFGGGLVGSRQPWERGLGGKTGFSNLVEMEEEVDEGTDEEREAGLRNRGRWLNK